MDIQWFGTASLAMETKDTKVLIDPFVPLNGGSSPTTLEDYLGYGDILITHGHIDHILSIPDIVRNSNARIHSTITPAVTLLDKGVDSGIIHLIQPGDSFMIGDLHITVFQGRHISFDRALIRTTLFSPKLFHHRNNLRFIARENRICIENGETIHYLIEESGKSIFVMGSLAFDENTSYPEGMDFLVLPYQGSSDIFHHALAAVKRCKPKAVILDHFDNTFPPISRQIDTSEFLNAFDGTPRVIIPEYKRRLKV